MCATVINVSTYILKIPLRPVETKDQSQDGNSAIKYAQYDPKWRSAENTNTTLYYKTFPSVSRPIQHHTMQKYVNEQEKRISSSTHQRISVSKFATI